MGVFQQFVPETRNRERADLRIDHEASKNDSLFLRGSYQHRDPNAIQFEAGNALTNLGIRDTNAQHRQRDRRVDARSSRRTVVNEFRVGYNYDKSERQSNFNVARRSNAAARPREPRPASDASRVGFPAFELRGRLGSDPAHQHHRRRPQRGPHDQAELVLDQRQPQLDPGRPLPQGGRRSGPATPPSTAAARGVELPRRATASTAPRPGNALARLPPGLHPRRRRPASRTRGDLDGHSDDFAFFVQDDWRVNRRPDGVPGPALRARGRLARERRRARRTSCPTDGGYHVVPNARSRPCCRPGVSALGRTKIAAEVGLTDTPDQHRQEQLQPARRLRLAARRRQQDRAPRRLRALPPDRGDPGPARPAGLQQVPLRAHAPGRGPLAQASRRARRPWIPPTFGNQGIDPNIQSPDIYQYNLTLERELPGDLGLRVSYIGSTMRKLLDRPRLQHDPAEHRRSSTPTNPDDSRGCRFPLYGFYMDNVDEPRRGPVPRLQVELRRRWKDGLALNVAYTLAHSDSNAPDSGNSSLGVVQFDPYDIEKDRGPDPNVVKHRVVANATWDIPVGHGRKHGANMPGWANALFGGWTVSTLFQARSGNNLTPFFSSFYTTSPWNTGKPLDGLGNNFCCAWRPDQISNPNTGGIARRVLRPGRVRAARRRASSATRRRGACSGPAPGSSTSRSTRTSSTKQTLPAAALGDAGQRVQPPAVLRVLRRRLLPAGRLPDRRRSRQRDDRPTSARASIANQEGFAPGRVFRIGLRATF